MHTAIMIGGGLVLMLIFALVARARPSWQSWTAAFAILWAAVTAINFYVGVMHAGYSIASEIAVNLVVFAVPVIAASAWRRFS